MEESAGTFDGLQATELGEAMRILSSNMQRLTDTIIDNFSKLIFKQYHPYGIDYVQLFCDFSQWLETKKDRTDNFTPTVDDIHDLVAEFCLESGQLSKLMFYRRTMMASLIIGAWLNTLHDPRRTVKGNYHLFRQQFRAYIRRQRLGTKVFYQLFMFLYPLLEHRQLIPKATYTNGRVLLIDGVLHLTVRAKRKKK